MFGQVLYLNDFFIYLLFNVLFVVVISLFTLDVQVIVSMGVISKHI